MAHTPFAVVAAMLIAFAATWLPQSESTPPTADVALNDSSVALRLAEQLPATLQFDDRMGTAQVATVIAADDIDRGDPMTSYRAGDVAYWASEQRVVIFLTDGAAVAADGLTLIGVVTDGFDHLTGCARDCAVDLTSNTLRSRT